MNARTRRHIVIAFAIGLLVTIGFQFMLGWWLNSGRGVVTMMAVLFAVAVVIAFWGSGSPGLVAAGLIVGAFVGMAATLFWTGPGTIWPVVLVVAAVMTTAAVFAGTGVAQAIRQRRS